MAMKQRIYSCDVTVFATAYIRAPNQKMANQLALGLQRKKLEVEAATHGRCEVEFSGRDYNDPELPEVSLSPAMTLGRPGIVQDVNK